MSEFQQTPDKHEVFRRSTLEEWLDNDQEAIQEILNQFLDEMPSYLEIIQNALDSGNLEELTRQAHTIKGAAGNCGALALSHIASLVEHAGGESDRNHLELKISELKDSMVDLKAFFEKPNESS